MYECPHASVKPSSMTLLLVQGFFIEGWIPRGRVCLFRQDSNPLPTSTTNIIEDPCKQLIGHQVTGEISFVLEASCLTGCSSRLVIDSLLCMWWRAPRGPIDNWRLHYHPQHTHMEHPPPALTPAPHLAILQHGQRCLAIFLQSPGWSRVRLLHFRKSQVVSGDQNGLKLFHYSPQLIKRHIPKFQEVDSEGGSSNTSHG